MVQKYTEHAERKKMARTGREIMAAQAKSKKAGVGNAP
jgi:hypothetical protein